MPDFSLLQHPDFAAAALGGYQAGMNIAQGRIALARQAQLNSALRGIDLNRPETLLPVIQADPSSPATGAALGLMTATREAAGRTTLADVVRLHNGLPTAGSPTAALSAHQAINPAPVALGASAPSSSAQFVTPSRFASAPALGAQPPADPGQGAAPTQPVQPALGAYVTPGAQPAPPPPSLTSSLPADPSAAPSTPPAPNAPAATPADASAAAAGDDGQEIIVTGSRGQKVPLSQTQEYQEATARLAGQLGPAEFSTTMQAIGRMDRDQLALHNDAQTALAHVGMGVQALPYQQRRAYIEQNRGYLLEHHVDPSQVDAFDPTDDNISNGVEKAMSIKEVMDVRHQALELGVQQDRNRIDEANNIRTNATSTANNIRTVGATTRGQDITDSRDRWVHSTPPAQNDTPSLVIGGILAKQAAGQPLNPQEQAMAAQYWAGRGRARGRAGAGAAPTATGPNGHKIVFQGGKWVDAQTLKPVG